MLDFLYVTGTFTFVLMLASVAGCERLGRARDEADDSGEMPAMSAHCIITIVGVLPSASVGGRFGTRRDRSSATAPIVDGHADSRKFGFFGEPYVSVPPPNIALDSALKRRNAPHPKRPTSMMRSAFALGALLVLPALLAGQAVPATPTAAAVPDENPKITFGGFVDGYYAFEFNRPATINRAYTTQPARHHEFNINLAFVEARLDAPTSRGRLALQTGTSVQSNYSGEPRNGNISGPDLARLIQEAVVGVKIADNVWIDGGIFLSHIGMEGFISRDNPMYTRSLVADFSPYYESGVKLAWQAAPTVTALFTVVNGWQNISETNGAKSGGVRIDYAPLSSSTFSYFSYIGDEAADTARHTAVAFSLL